MVGWHPWLGERAESSTHRKGLNLRMETSSSGEVGTQRMWEADILVEACGNVLLIASILLVK